MPKRHRHRKMKGGFLDSLSNWASNAWSSTKKATGLGDSSSSYGTSYDSTGSTGYGSTGSTGSYGSTDSYGSTGSYGGKTRRKRIKGGYRANSSTTGLASQSASFSGNTAKPHTWVGGRTRRNHGGKHRCSKSCKIHNH